MSFVNRSRRPLLVTSDLSVSEYAHFAHTFRADAFGLNAELIATAEDFDPATLPARYLLWRYDNAPALPSDPDVGSLVTALAEHLESGHAAVLAMVAPGQALQDAPALLVAHDGTQWLGTAGGLLANPGPFQVHAFNEDVLAKTAGRAR